MTWSTSQLAELANTTVNTVRHYHELGLLEVPERSSNGYKQYRVSHLLRLLQLRRLSELGISLSQIAGMDADDEVAFEEVRALDETLRATIDRLSGVRAELAQVLTHRVPAETPAGFAAAARGLTRAQRSLLAVYATVLDEATLEAFRHALAEPQPTDEEFEALPEDADEARVDDLARRMVAPTLGIRQRHPGLLDPLSRSPHGEQVAGRLLGRAMVELYHPAQLRVLQRLDELLSEH